MSFFIGYFYYRYCKRWLSFRSGYAVFLLIFIIMVPMFEFNKTSFVLRMPIALSASFVIIGLSAAIGRYTGLAALTAKLLTFLGRNSLIVYLVHFLFVVGSDFQVETGNISSITLFCLLLPVAVLISLLCIGVSKVLSPSKFLSKLVFGK